MKLFRNKNDFLLIDHQKQTQLVTSAVSGKNDGIIAGEQKWARRLIVTPMVSGTLLKRPEC